MLNLSFSGILKEYRIHGIQNKFESELLAAQQNLEVLAYSVNFHKQGWQQCEDDYNVYKPWALTARF